MKLPGVAYEQSVFVNCPFNAVHSPLSRHMTVHELETLLMPLLEEMAEGLKQQFPYVKANACSSAAGSRTDYQGHSYCVDCLITNAKPEDPDNVALEVATSYLTTTPRINADICWGHPSGQIEAEVFEASQPLTAHTIEKILVELPRLYLILQAAVARRSPSTEAD